MTALLLVSLALISPAAAAFPLPTTAPAPALVVAIAPIGAPQGKNGGDDKKKDGRKEVSKLVDEMKKLVGAKKDDDAIVKIDEMVREYAESGPKDRKKIADAIAKNLTVQRIPPEGSQEQPRIFLTCVVALSQMSTHGSKHLQAAYDFREWKRDISFRGRILKLIGDTKDASAVEFLIKELVDKDAPIVADAASALGNFVDAKEDDRKKIAEKLINLINSLQGQAADTSTPQGLDARQRYEAISPGAIDSLQRLTGQTFRQPIEWQKWWNDNKSKPW